MRGECGFGEEREVDVKDKKKRESIISRGRWKRYSRRERQGEEETRQKIRVKKGG